MIILKWILKIQGVVMWTGFIWLTVLTSGDPSKHGNEPSGSIKGRIFLD
jgi:hypothetical protein